MSHTHDDMLALVLGCDFNQLSKGWTEGVESFNTESFEVGEFCNQEIDKALIPAKSFKSVDSLLLSWLKNLKIFDSSLDERFQEVSFLFAAQMHVLIPNFIHVGVS